MKKGLSVASPSEKDFGMVYYVSREGGMYPIKRFFFKFVKIKYIYVMCLIEFRSKNIYTHRIHRVCTCVQKEFFCVTGYIS